MPARLVAGRNGSRNQGVRLHAFRGEVVNQFSHCEEISMSTIAEIGQAEIEQKYIMYLAKALNKEVLGGKYEWVTARPGHRTLCAVLYY